MTEREWEVIRDENNKMVPERLAELRQEKWFIKIKQRLDGIEGVVLTTQEELTESI